MLSIGESTTLHSAQVVRLPPPLDVAVEAHHQTAARRLLGHRLRHLDGREHLVEMHAVVLLLGAATAEPAEIVDLHRIELCDPVAIRIQVQVAAVGQEGDLHTAVRGERDRAVAPAVPRHLLGQLDEAFRQAPAAPSPHPCHRRSARCGSDRRRRLRSRPHLRLHPRGPGPSPAPPVATTRPPPSSSIQLSRFASCLLLPFDNGSIGLPLTPLARSRWRPA